LFGNVCTQELLGAQVFVKSLHRFVLHRVAVGIDDLAQDNELVGMRLVVVKHPSGFAIIDTVGYQLVLLLVVDEGVVRRVAEELVCLFLLGDAVALLEEKVLERDDLLPAHASD